ncbi:MAG: chemotaxis protein CheW [Lentisphaerae bacterium]|nr:chemotaxis protein CheW [Lentisphaerota bacterium]
MLEPHQLLVITMGEQRVALPLSAVERVVRLVDITPLPDASPPVLGVIDVAGDILPVVSLRQRLAIADRTPALTDRLIIVRTPARRLAVLVDDVQDVAAPAAEAVTPATPLLSAHGDASGLLRMPDGLAVIIDPHAFLLPQETAALDAALGRAARTGDARTP